MRPGTRSQTQKEEKEQMVGSMQDASRRERDSPRSPAPDLQEKIKQMKDHLKGTPPAMPSFSLASSSATSAGPPGISLATPAEVNSSYWTSKENGKTNRIWVKSGPETNTKIKEFLRMGQIRGCCPWIFSGWDFWDSDQGMQQDLERFKLYTRIQLQASIPS